MANYAKAYTPLFHPIIDKYNWEPYKWSLILPPEYKKPVDRPPFVCIRGTMDKIVKVTDAINVVIVNNLITIKLDVLTHMYPPLPSGKYLHLFGHCNLRILVDQFNIAKHFICLI